MLVSELLQEAVHIGDRIIREAVQSGDECTWWVVEAERVGNAYVPRHELAGAQLYGGTSGIALFLGELWGITGERAYLACARRALKRAERSPLRVPSLHSGRLGVALVAARLAELTRDEQWRDVAAAQLSGLHESVATCSSDIIGGAAGIILGLLRIEQMAGFDGLSDLALQFGAHLEELAQRTPDGWSWNGAPGTATRNLTGYAHGASGMAHAFLELYAVSGDSRWRFAASRAIAYERKHMMRETFDWPDFRSFELMSAMEDGIPALRARLRAGEQLASDSHPLANRLWCHGSPGIALARARALHLNVETTQVESELIGALNGTRETLLNGRLLNHSLCHGVFGNAEILLIAREHLGIDDAGTIDKAIENAWASSAAQGGTWVTGVVGGGHNPALMTGESGIGHFLLRLARPGVPSVLCQSNWLRGPDGQPPNDEPRVAELSSLLPRSFCAARLLPGAEYVFQQIRTLTSSTEDIATIVTAVRELILSIPSTVGDQLRDALSVDAAVLDEQSAFTDFTAQYCQELIRPTMEEIDLNVDYVSLSPHARIIQTTWSWSQVANGEIATPPADNEFFVLFRTARRVQLKSITPLHAAILSTLRERTRLNEVVTSTLASLEVDSLIASLIPNYIGDVVREAIVLGAVCVVP